MDSDRSLRVHLIRLLDAGNAHIRFDDAVANFPAELRGTRPDGAPHSAWELLEHLRLALWDILEFSRSADHVSPEFPSGYWPASAAPPSDAAWDESVAAYRAHLRDFASLIETADLFTPLPWGDGKTVLREVLVAVDHNAYHLGQLVMVRRMLER